MESNDVLNVTIIPEDFRNAPDGYGAGREDQGCVLQQALRRMYPGEYVFVGPTKAAIGQLPNQIQYKIDTEKDWGCTEARFSCDKINELSEQAKQSLEGIPTVSLTLTRI